MLDRLTLLMSMLCETSLAELSEGCSVTDCLNAHFLGGAGCGCVLLSHPYSRKEVSARWAREELLPH